MSARHWTTPLAAIAALVPCLAGSGTGNLRGKLLPDLPQHLEYAERDLSHGEVSTALAHVSLVLMDKPVRYRVNMKDVPSGLHPACRAAFRDAVALWESAFPGEIRFSEVGDGEQADLTVTFQNDVRQAGNPVAGIVNWRRKIVESKPATCHLSADMHLRILQPNGRYMQLEHMRHTAAHELGHVLGLDDSPFYGDIMGPLDLSHPAVGFEATELEELRQVRADAYALRKKALKG